MILAQVRGLSIYKGAFEHSVALGLGIYARDDDLSHVYKISSRREDSGNSVQRVRKDGTVWIAAGKSCSLAI